MADSHYNKIKPYKYDPKGTIEIVYQLVDNFYPLSTEELQREIEVSPLCLEKTEFFKKYSTRYIRITVGKNMTTDEIFNFGKRISIIEQRLIVKSKNFVNETVNKGVATSHMNFIKSILETLQIKNVETKDVVARMKNYVKTATKPIKSRATRSTLIKRK